MKFRPPLKLAWLRFTSCSGCQLMLLDCEESLAALADVIEFDSFPLVTSARGHERNLDLALVEGAVSSPAEVKRLLRLRRQSRLLVAVGACALTGGVNTLVKARQSRSLHDIYGDQSADWDSFPPQPAHNFVTVDWQIRGCPPERHELQNGIGALLHGGWPGRGVMPVCMECRCGENRCLLEEDHAPCLGPVTHAGCHARCPGVGVPCEGCRGLVPEANRDELAGLLAGFGLPEREIRQRLQRFGEPPHDQADR